jgi:hypothetical protein
MPQLTYLGNDLLESIRNIAMVGKTGATGSKDADLLRHASEGIREYLVAEIAALREEYYVVREREALVSGTSIYRIPSRAMWDKLTNLWVVRGGATGDRHKVNPLDKAELDKYNDSGADFPRGYVVDGNWIRMIPDTSSAYTGDLEWVYMIRSGDIVLATEARQITAVTPATKQVTVAAIPSSWSSASIFDVHSAYGGADYKMWGQTVSAASGTNITFTNEIDGSVFGTKELAVGDWVCLENESALPGVPRELYPIVARIAAMHWAEAIGNDKKFRAHAEVVKAYMKQNLRTMEVRVEEKPIRIGRRRSFLGARRWRY